MPVSKDTGKKVIELEVSKEKVGRRKQDEIEQEILDLIFADLKKTPTFSELAHQQQVLKYGISIDPKIAELLESLENARVKMFQARNVEFLDAVTPGKFMSATSAYQTTKADSALSEAKSSLADAKEFIAKLYATAKKLSLKDKNILSLEAIDVAYDLFSKKGFDFTSWVNVVNLQSQAKEIERVQKELIKTKNKLERFPDALARVEEKMLDWVYTEKETILKDLNT